MFFAPTILGLNATQENLEVSSLCLSVGNADGLGDIRRKEYHDSYEVLGVPPERRWIVDHPCVLIIFLFGLSWRLICA
jgi:N-acetylglucosaminylphosphatidylinositol deacetylase